MNQAPITLRESTPEETDSALAEFFAAQRAARARADQAREQLTAAVPVLVRAIRTGTGQSEKVAAIVWSVWNGDHKVGLCDVLSGLDTDISAAVIALIAARAHMSGNADDLIRRILTESGEFDALQTSGNLRAA